MQKSTISEVIFMYPLDIKGKVNFTIIRSVVAFPAFFLDESTSVVVQTFF
jgi:hypothetical protein